MLGVKRVFTALHRQRLSLASLGKPKSPEHCEAVRKAKSTPEQVAISIANLPKDVKGKNNPRYGVKLSAELKARIAASVTGKLAKEKHPLWKGGKTYQMYPEGFIKFTITVFKRDEFKCRVCGKWRGQGCKRIVRHHIDYNKQNCDEHNLITLYNSCHGKTTSGDRTYWQAYLTKMIEEIYSEVQ